MGRSKQRKDTMTMKNAQIVLVAATLMGVAGAAARVSDRSCSTGLLASLLFSQTLTSLLFDIAPFDAATLAGVSLLLLAVAAAAAWSPAGTAGGPTSATSPSVGR